MPNRDALRDFFYLDIERVRSLVAQGMKGTPDAVERTSTQHGGAGIKILDYAYETSNRETRSIHHYIFTQLQETLEDANRLLVIGQDYAKELWTEELMADGQLVLLNGYIRLIDFERLTDAMEAFPQFLQTAQQMEKLSLKKKLGSGEITQAEYKQAISQQTGIGMDKKDFRGMIDIVGKMYADTLRLKVFPYDADHRRYFACNLNPDSLQQPRGNLWLSGGVESASQWWVMGIINQLRAGESRKSEGSTLEDKLEDMLLTFAEINKVTSSIEFPAVSFSPLAVYREL